MTSRINFNHFNFSLSYFVKTQSKKIYNIFHQALSKSDDWIRTENPVTGTRSIRFIPISIENSLAMLFYPLLILQGGGRITKENSKYGNYVGLVQKIGKELATHCPRKDSAIAWEFELLLDHSKTFNAWCLFGGKIAITRSLIEKMDKDHETYGLDREPSIQEKIAAVLAHEVTHEAAGHLSQGFLYSLLGLVLFVFLFPVLLLSILSSSSGHRIMQSLTDLIEFIWNIALLYKSRGQELEADKGSIYLLHELGKSENSIGLKSDSLNAAIWMAHFFKNHADHGDSGNALLDRLTNFFSTHPSWTERLETNQKTVEQLLQGPNPNDPYLIGYRKV